MTRLAFLIAGLALLLSTTAAAERPGPSWRVVCDHDATAREPLCHVSTFAQDKSNGTWLGIAVQILNGTHEVQVTSSGEAYHSAEIDADAEATSYTDYCHGSYCVFLHAESLVERFKAESPMKVRLFNGTTRPSIEKRISLLGFTEAYEEYRRRIGE